MAVTVYEKPTCTTCRKLVKLLKEQGIEFDAIEYHVTGLSEEEIRGLLKKAKLNPSDALRLREEGARALATEPDDVIVAAMAQRPELLQRPIVVNGDQAVLARPIEKVLEIL